jgi:hypothetical protein
MLVDVHVEEFVLELANDVDLVMFLGFYDPPDFLFEVMLSLWVFAQSLCPLTLEMGIFLGSISELLVTISSILFDPNLSVIFCFLAHSHFIFNIHAITSSYSLLLNCDDKTIVDMVPIH